MLPPHFRTFLFRFRRFLRAHHAAVTVGGAALVFATFVVNQVLLDNLKSVISAERSARDRVEYDKQFQELDVQIRYVQSQLDAMRHEMSAPPSGGGLVEDTEPLGSLVDRLDAMLEGAESLMNALPTDIDREKRFIHARLSLLQLHLNFPTDERDANSAGEVRSYQNQVFELGNEIESMSRDWLDVARRLRVKHARSYGRWTVVSYVLYAIGWAAGLLGKLYSVRG